MKDRQHDNVMNLLMLLSRSKMTNRIVALHSQSKRNDAVEKNGTLLCFAGCVGSSITSELLTKHVGSKCYPALLLRINESPLMLLQWCLLTFSSLWTGVLVNTRRAQTKRIICNGKKMILLTTFVGPLAQTQWPLTRARNQFEFGS